MAGEVIPYTPNVAAPARQAHMLPQNFEEATRMATAIAQSGLFGCKTTAEAFSLMLLADAEGLHPAAAARDYHIIEGRPSLKADAMLARYLNAGGKIEWLERSDTKVAATFTHPSSGTVTVEWTIERAKGIKRKSKSLTDGDNWKNYPRQMLAARTISEGVRASYPGVVSGVYTPEEVMDFEPAAPVSSRAVAPQPPVSPAVEVEATEAGGAVSDAAPPVSPSLKHSFTGDSESDGLPKGKSAYAAKKDGDWQRVSERLDEELKDCATKAEATIWWEKVRTTDEEYQALPQDWRKTYRDEHYMPVLAGLDDEAQTVEWTDEPGARG